MRAGGTEFIVTASADEKSPRGWLRREADAYRNGNERPLGGYLVLAGMYTVATAALAGAARSLGRTVRTPGPWDLALLTVATHKAARLIAKDPITSPFRAPFTTFEGTSAESELAESVRGEGFRHAAGELIVCPMCLGQWVATGFSLSWILAPQTTRLAMSMLTAVAGADFLHHSYAALQQATEG